MISISYDFHACLNLWYSFIAWFLWIFEPLFVVFHNMKTNLFVFWIQLCSFIFDFYTICYVLILYLYQGVFWTTCDWYFTSIKFYCDLQLWTAFSLQMFMSYHLKLIECIMQTYEYWAFIFLSSLCKCLSWIITFISTYFYKHVLVLKCIFLVD